MHTAKYTTSAPYPLHRACHAVCSIGSHGRLDDFQWLAEGGDLKHVQAGT